MFEVMRQDLGAEQLFIEDFEGLAIGSPSDDVLVLWVFHHPPGFLDEARH